MLRGPFHQAAGHGLSIGLTVRHAFGKHMPYNDQEFSCDSDDGFLLAECDITGKGRGCRTGGG